MREPNEQTAAQKSFSLAATVPSYGGSNPTAGGTRTGATGNERTWLMEVLARANDGTECCDQWVLRQVHPDGSAAWIRIYRLDGCNTLRIGNTQRISGISTQPVSGTWLHHHSDAATIRSFWNDCVQNQGYTLYTHHRLTGSQLALLVATGIWGVEDQPTPTPGAVTASKSLIDDRIIGKIISLP
jgi:hypothetical protein